MNPFLAVAFFLLAVVASFLIVSLLLWWLVPLAFPALSFSFSNAMALAGIGLLFAGLASAG